MGTEEDGSYGFTRLLSAQSSDWGAVQSAAVAAGGGAGFAGNYYDSTDDPLFTTMEGYTGRGMRSKVRTGRLRVPRHGDGRAAIDWVTAQRAAGTPVLAHISLLKPHYPFNVPQRFYDLVDPADIDLDLMHPREAVGVDVVDDYLFTLRGMSAATDALPPVHRSHGDDCLPGELAARSDELVTEDTVLCVMGDRNTSATVGSGSRRGYAWRSASLWPSSGAPSRVTRSPSTTPVCSPVWTWAPPWLAGRRAHPCRGGRGGPERAAAHGGAADACEPKSTPAHGSSTRPTPHRAVERSSCPCSGLLQVSPVLRQRHQCTGPSSVTVQVEGFQPRGRRERRMVQRHHWQP